MMSKIESEGEDGISEASPDGRFIRYDEVIGRGSFKVVYKGFDQDSGADVAWCQIKIDDALASSSLAENLFSEAALMKSMEHENITKCHYWWIDRANMNINMITELFTSGTLRQYRNKHKYVNMKAIKNWGMQILKGLHYLHAHNPPIVHRDLKCDNIFVNGHSGQVKIGDLGLATLMQQQQHRLVSVIGTPEFMAPELYNEDYDELVDVYSFGMCMLELMTCEYPYYECNNVAQIFKKVTTGVKPLALGKVKDPQAKGLIEKCLLPASQRPSAAELLKDPFFSLSQNSIVKGLQSAPSGDIMMPKCTHVPEPESQDSVSVVSNYDKLSSGTSSPVGRVESSSNTPFYTVESSRSTIQGQFRLRGTRIDRRTISFNLHIIDKGSLVAKCFEFSFDLKADDALKIALELADEKELRYHQVADFVGLVDSVLLELEPNWIPCPGFHNQSNLGSRCRQLSSNLQFQAVIH